MVATEPEDRVTLKAVWEACGRGFGIFQPIPYAGFVDPEGKAGLPFPDYLLTQSQLPIFHNVSR